MPYARSTASKTRHCQVSVDLIFKMYAGQNPVKKFNRKLLLSFGLFVIFLSTIAVHINKPIFGGIPYTSNVLDWRKKSGDSGIKFPMLSRKRDVQHGYVLAVRYSGQQASSIKALTSLQCWVASFNLSMYILQPITNNTMFFSIPPNRYDSYLSFSDLFDIQHFNRLSESSGYASMRTREEFFSHAPRNAIFVKPGPMNLPTRVIWEADYKRDGHHNCYNMLESIEALQKLAKEHNFCFVRILEAPYNRVRMAISDKEVREVVFGDQAPQHITLIFIRWQSPFFIKNNDLSNPLECQNVGKRSNFEQLRPSPTLLSHVNFYETHFLNFSKDVALMFRIERIREFLHQNQHSREWTVQKCLNEAVRVTKEKLTSGCPMVTLDLGTFGSASLSKKLRSDKKPLTEEAKLLITDLYSNKLTFEEWEESFNKATGGVKNNGYIAALQRTLASRAKCLVLVGGGSFQELALKDYLKNHPNKEDHCVHLLCTMNERELREVIYRFNNATTN